MSQEAPKKKEKVSPLAVAFLVIAACMFVATTLFLRPATKPTASKPTVARETAPTITPEPTYIVAPTKPARMLSAEISSTDTPAVSGPTPIVTDTPSDPAAQAGADTNRPVITPKKQNVNIRSGPGANTNIIGTLQFGQTMEVIGRTVDGTWWKVPMSPGAGWIAASVVDAFYIPDDLPVEEVAVPTDTPTAIPAPLPTNTPQVVEIPTLAPVPTFPPADTSSGSSSGGGCCKYCSKGKPCGDSCISKNKTCNKPPGCAC